jgi:hypothetical protein
MLTCDYTQKLAIENREKAKINLVTLHLCDAAQEWFYGLNLDDEIPSSSNDEADRIVKCVDEWFRGKLFQRFKRNEAEAWRELNGIF